MVQKLDHVASAWLVMAIVCAGCGTDPGTLTEPPPGAYLITITAAGANPRTITVPRGSQITFQNNDTRAHDMQSDPHPEHNDCPEIAHAGYLRPGEVRSTGNLNLARTCGFHDNQNEGIAALRGTITIQ